MAEGWLDSPYALKGKRIWIAGHSGMVGTALMRRLEKERCEVLIAPRYDLDLRDQAAVKLWLDVNKPDVVVLAAAKVGGIMANASAPADFLYDNMMIEANVIHGAFKAGVEKLLFLGSSCIYPKAAQNPITEEALLSGALEPTNEAYAIAKIAGVKLCQGYRAQYGCDFISAMPCNLYGRGDTFDAQNSHVIPALMMKAHAAKIAGDLLMPVWGSGQPRREFMYVDDLADALVFMLKNYSDAPPLNIGSGEEVTILDLAEMIADTVGYKGALEFDTSKPDGTMQKLLNSSRIRAAGWAPQTNLRDGLARTYDWYSQQEECRHAA